MKKLILSLADIKGIGGARILAKKKTMTFI